MLATRALAELNRGLAAAIASLELSATKFGAPEEVQRQAELAERLFQGYTKGGHNAEGGYEAARSLLRGQQLTAWQRDVVAGVITAPIKEAGGQIVLSHAAFPNLLATYEQEARQGELWRLTWHGLLASYFAYDPLTQHAGAAFVALREFLGRTWPLIDRQAGDAHVPDWIAVLRRDTKLLSEHGADEYGRAWLNGDTAPAERVASQLGVPSTSWFWHAVILSAIKHATAHSADRFRALLARLIALVRERPAFRDEAIEVILCRYHEACGGAVHEELRDFVVGAWKNPKLKSAGLATAWNRVPEAVWRMVLAWVNEQNLRDFFDILAARNSADAGRLAFWSKYLKQITSTRLVFGADTLALSRRNETVRNLIAREEGAYAKLTAKREVDAFMMHIGNYVIVEFSKKPNACYVYQARSLPFKPYERYYTGGSEDLAAGFHGAHAARIVHRDGWQQRAEDELRTLGIFPDAQAKPDHRPPTRPEPRAQPQDRTEASERLRNQRTAGGPDMVALSVLLARFDGAWAGDERSVRGRLWVHDPKQNARLAKELEALGFRWARLRGAWYFPAS